MIRFFRNAFATFLSACGGGALAEEIVIRFEINPVMFGSRPWDGTGLNSAQLDGGGGGGGLLGGLDLTQPLLDQTNLRMAPPDPYVCFILDRSGELRCDQASARQNAVRLEIDFDTSLARDFWYGVVLVDSDAGNIFGGGDDLIGFGVVIDEDTYGAVLAGDEAARRRANGAVEIVTAAVQARFGRSQNFLGGGERAAARLAQSKCEYGCQFGDAQITLSAVADGW
jgi:hypothetical protein